MQSLSVFRFRTCAVTSWANCRKSRAHSQQHHQMVGMLSAGEGDICLLFFCLHLATVDPILYLVLMQEMRFQIFAVGRMTICCQSLSGQTQREWLDWAMGCWLNQQMLCNAGRQHCGCKDSHACPLISKGAVLGTENVKRCCLGCWFPRQRGRSFWEPHLQCHWWNFNHTRGANTHGALANAVSHACARPGQTD